ncbi:MAG: hypothetical protein ABI591_12490 [Kofleriaceae bacterium]
MRLLTILAISLSFTLACGDGGNNNTPKDAGPGSGSGVVDGGTPDASCFTTAAIDCANPAVSADQCNTEIINACTAAQKILNTSKPPLLEVDGTLPPLP